MSSTRKDSLASSWSSNPSALETGEGNRFDTDNDNQPSSRSRLPPRPCPSREIYGASSRHRPLYLAARAGCIGLGLVLIALSVIALRGLRRDRWMAPILSPAIQSCCTSGIDVWLVLARSRRAPPLQRLLYDGAIAVGFAIAGGFLVAFTLSDVRRTREGSTVATAAVGLLILLCMFSEMLLHLGISITGGRDVVIQVRRRRERDSRS